MRHRNHSMRLSQKPPLARMMCRNLVTSMLLYERVRTTKKRAEVMRPLLDHVITIAKKDNPMNAIRRMNEIVTHPNASKKVLEVLVDRFKNRTSGYTRMVPVGMRKGDGALLVDVMFVDQADHQPILEKEASATKESKIKKTAKKSSAKKK